MPITELLEKNAKEYPNDVCLVEINPDVHEKKRIKGKENETDVNRKSGALWKAVQPSRRGTRK